ncbi:MAG TPA: hypothetical protein VGN74_11640 [Brevundimonas sp.]|jgi:hypothetical protein|nr:hypothetical protein [Brevundimonas sp.]
MKTPTDYTTTFALVGEFMFVWSHLEQKMTQSIGQLARLEGLAVVAIIGANMGTRDKINTLKSLLLWSGSDDDEWKKAVNRLCSRIADRCGDRNIIAHNTFAPGKKGGIKFWTVSAKGELKLPDLEWDLATVRQKIQQILDLYNEIEPLTEQAMAHAALWRAKLPEVQQARLANHQTRQAQSPPDCDQPSRKE